MGTISPFTNISQEVASSMKRIITTETPSSSAESTEQGILISSTSEGSSTKVEIETDASTNPTTTIVTLEEKTTESTSEVITSDVFSTGISASSEVTTQEHSTATESTVTESSTAATTFHSTTDGTISPFTNISQEVASSTKGIITTETPSSSAESTEQVRRLPPVPKESSPLRHHPLLQKVLNKVLISSTSEGSSTKVEIETDASTNPTTTIVTLEEKTTESTSEVITSDVFSTGISASSEVTTQEHSTATESTVTESSTAATTFHSTTDGTISPFTNISQEVASSTKESSPLRHHPLLQKVLNKEVASSIKGIITTETPSSSAESTEQGTLISSTSEGSSTKVEIETDASTNPTTTIVTLEEKTTESTSEVITSDVFSTGISASSEVTTQEHSTATESTVTESSTAATTFHSTTDGTISPFTNISQEVASSTKGIITTETPSSSAESTEQGISFHQQVKEVPPKLK
ncbi:hypothetical protein BSL78_10759 [Apostichopus japonicus]|uniref:Uncharacterized protein n=1 Tax=Stichopus japonicus TaxID=307972 RepID=A0A2G8KWI1_STIJA|nr:hypothetical protein BSL78_10759 [Apostichopus japonicus]